MAEILLDIAQELWMVAGEMAPFLLFGFFMAGVLYVLVPAATVERHLGGRGLLPVTKAAIFGIPLPLCSCGVIPVAASLRRHGASRGATTAFIIATPQTGVDSILVTFGLLGGVFAVFRPLAALVSGTLGGWLASVAGGAEDAEGASPPECEDSCCDGEGGRRKLLGALRYGFVTLPRDIAKPLVAGLLAAGLISVVVPEDYFAEALGTGIAGMLVMMLVGMPIYVCATASVPVAAALMAKGISPGAALVFLMTGPATNAATIGTVWKLVGKRSAVAYLATVALTALASGLVLDWIVAARAVSVAPAMGWMLPGSIRVAALVVLAAVLVVAMLHKPKKIGEADLAGEHETVRLSIRGMHCSHCVEAVHGALVSSQGVEVAEVDLKAGEAVVRGSGFDVAGLCRAIEELGYSAEPLRESGAAEKAG